MSSSSSGLPLAITPADNIVLNCIIKKDWVMDINKGEDSFNSISVRNTSEKRIIIKLRSNAGKRLRIKPSVFALEINQTITLEIKIASIYVEELIQKYQETNSLESFRVQFNVAAVSDLFYNGISSDTDKDQAEQISQQWGNITKSDVQQMIIPLTLSYNSIPSTLSEERKSDESLRSIAISESPEYKKLRTQYDGICLVVKRCQEIVKKLQDEKKDLESKLSEKEEEVNTLKLLSEQASSELKATSQSSKQSILTGITVVIVVIAFVAGFVLGQFASRFMME